MAETGSRLPLEELLTRALASEGQGSAAGPGLWLRRRRLGRREAGEVLLHRGAESDPLTGHRDAGAALHVVAQAEGLLVELQLRRESGGSVVRGQVLQAGAEALDLNGALVHLRGEGGSAMACVEESGEFRFSRVPGGALVGLDLELDDRVVRLAWPGTTAEPRGS